MTTSTIIAIIVALLSGTGLGGLVAVLIKSGAERQSIIVGSAEKAVSIQTAVLEGLRLEVERLTRENQRLILEVDRLESENRELREALA